LVRDSQETTSAARTIILRAMVAASIGFVWVVRHDNIIQEFKQYGLPDWSRDLVGILKLTLCCCYRSASSEVEPAPLRF
jgi:hypothetical protein